jgi:hypothetical protein
MKTEQGKKMKNKNKYEEKYIDIKYNNNLTENEKIIKINELKNEFNYENLYAN